MGSRIEIVVGEGRSMLPTIQTGDRLLCELAPQPIAVGDIVVFGGDGPQTEIAHRIVWIDPLGGLWECGDAPGFLPNRRFSHEVTARVVALARGRAWLEFRLRPRSRRWIFWAIAKQGVLRGRQAVRGAIARYRYRYRF